MPNLMDNDTSMQQLKTPSNYGFSAIGIDKLGASEYTLVTVVCDESGSVSGFAKDLERCIQTVVASCSNKNNPRADNLLLRAVSFNDRLKEVHGFRLVADIDTKEYDKIIKPSGGTALFDSVYSALEATNTFGTQLCNQDYSANGVVYVITDGCNNSSVQTPKTIRKLINDIAKAEKMNSIAVILIMVGYADVMAKAELDKFAKDAQITQFIDMTELFAKASPEKALAKLAGYISKSISSTSQALASGSSTAASSQLTI